MVTRRAWMAQRLTLLKLLGNLANHALEGELTNQQLTRPLVATDLAQSNRPRSVAVGLPHSAGGGPRLPRGLEG
eukprot:2457578-Rhodomonas_salina.2